MMLLFTYKGLKRIAMVLIGFTVILLGLIMLITPGPGIVAIIAGLSILATELVWARVLLKRIKTESEPYTKGFMGWIQKHYKSSANQNDDTKKKS